MKWISKLLLIVINLIIVEVKSHNELDLTQTIKRNLIQEDFIQILYESSNTLYSDVVSLDENNFIVCGQKIFLYTKTSSTYNRLLIESGVEARKCYALSADEFVVSYKGTDFVDSFKNKIFKKDSNGQFQTDNVVFSRSDTGFARNIFSLDPNKEFICFSASYIQTAGNPPCKLLIYRRINGVFNFYDEKNIGLHDRGSDYFRNKYIIQAKAENKNIFVFSLTIDYKVSVNLVHQTITSLEEASAVLAFDDNILIIGFVNGDLKIYTFNDNNNQFSETSTISTTYAQYINKITKINEFKFAVTYRIGNGISAGTVIFMREDNSYNFSEIKVINSLWQNINRSFFISGDILITTYDTRHYIYKMSCPSTSMVIIDGNCHYCSNGLVQEDNICKSKCFNIYNKANIFSLCEYCGTQYNGGSSNNKLNIISNTCESSCPINLIQTQIPNSSSFICLCPSNYILKNGTCEIINNNTNNLCGKGGYLNSTNSICTYCPSNYQEELESKIYYSKSSGLCVNSCTFPYVKNEENINEFYCELCSDTQKFYNQQSCVDICPNKFKKYILQGVLIWECVKECGISYLSGSNGECIECPSDKKYISLNNGKEECYSKCPPNHIVDESLKRCTNCEGNFVVIDNKCIDCIKNKDKKTISFNNECIEKCPVSYAYDINKNTCVKEEDKAKIYTNRPNCPLFTTLLENGFICTDQCDNLSGYFISANDVKSCVKCELENTLIRNNRCVNKCLTNEDIDYDFISKKNFEDFKCKLCKDLKVKKLNFMGKCTEKCPDNFEEINKECRIKAEIKELYSCENYCYNDGECLYESGKPKCDCSKVNYLGLRCDIDFNMLDYYTDYTNEMLFQEEYEKVLFNVINIPQLLTPNFKHLIFNEINKILKMPISKIKSNKKEIYKLIDIFNLVSIK